MFSEFRPPNWQPASNAAAAPIATVRRLTRDAWTANDFRVIRHLPERAARRPQQVTGRLAANWRLVRVPVSGPFPAAPAVPGASRPAAGGTQAGGGAVVP